MRLLMVLAGGMMIDLLGCSEREVNPMHSGEQGPAGGQFDVTREREAEKARLGPDESQAAGEAGETRPNVWGPIRESIPGQAPAETFSSATGANPVTQPETYEYYQRNQGTGQDQGAAQGQ